MCGQVCFFGLGTHSNYNKTQTEQFFHNDLRPVIRDSNDYVLDEQQQLPPHLLPPPFLIDDHGQAYPSAIQRFVPGRENYSDNDNTATVINHEYLDGTSVEKEKVKKKTNLNVFFFVSIQI